MKFSVLNNQFKSVQKDMARKFHMKPFRSTREEIGKKWPKKTKDNKYHYAFTDLDFLLREEIRPVRLQLELLKTELMLQDNGVENTMVFFGSARLPPYEIAKKNLLKAKNAAQENPNAPKIQQQLKQAERIADNSSYLQEATKLAYYVSSDENNDFVVVTGGGPSFMEAANKGAFEANSRSIALNISLPFEQEPNPYVTPELTFQFHYFAIRKFHFLIRARALAAFPGGFGTLDELFESLTLIQKEKMEKIPVILFNEKFWRRTINFEALIEEGTISEEDLNLFQYVETADQAWQLIREFYSLK